MEPFLGRGVHVKGGLASRTGRDLLKPEGNFVVSKKRCVGHSQVSDNTRLIGETAVPRRNLC